MTQLDNVLYVVYYESSTIEMYSTDTLSQLGQDILVVGMSEPNDIVVCRDDRQLYIADWYRIWRVSADDHFYVRWLGTEPITHHYYWPTNEYTMSVYTLSVRSRRLLVTSWSWPNTLRQYSTTDRQLLHEIKMPGYMKQLYHGVETTRGTFIVCHWGTSLYERKWAVSEIRYYTVVPNVR